MKKANLSLKETYAVALQNYIKKNFEVTESLCKKILSIDANHFDSLVLLSNIYILIRRELLFASFLKTFLHQLNNSHFIEL